MVREARKIDTAAVPGLEAGGIFSGRKALEYKLVDEIGGEDAAVAWLEKDKAILKDLPVLDRKPKPETRWDGGWLGSEAGAGGHGRVSCATVASSRGAPWTVRRMRHSGPHGTESLRA